MINSSAKHIALTATILLLTACSQQATPVPQTESREGHVPIAPIRANEQQLEKFDGPFGLKMGLARSEIEKIIHDLRSEDGSPSWSSASTVPTPHPDFESYSLQFSEKSGLCVIVGIGKDVQSGNTGSEIRTKFDSLDEALSSKYGKGKKYDFSSERYDSPEFWMLHLLQKNRTLAKVWDRDTKATLLNNISSIFMQAHASNITTGYVNVRYEFENIDDCTTEEKAKATQAL